MEKILFKGIQQVTKSKFDAVENKKGYLWFVREPMTDGEGVDNLLANDKYHIYFGSRCYGSFWEGEHEVIAASLKAIQNAVGLGDDFSFAWEETTNVVAAFDKVKSWYDAISQALDSKADASAVTELSNSVNAKFEKLLVKDVDANDKVLTVADGILSSTISLGYDSTSHRISLKGKDGEELGYVETDEFIKDSFLESVEVIDKEVTVGETVVTEKFIQFTWNTESGKETSELQVSKFAKFYYAGTALDLTSDGTFNVKVAANGNFLSVNDSNELIVDDVTTDKTMLKEAITIEGGPLATDAVKNAFKNEETGECVIPAGTDIQAVLKALLCVEIYPVPTKNRPEYTASISYPSVTSDDASTGATVEIGTSITFKSVTAKAVSTTPTHPKVSGFTHGYSSTIDGDINAATLVSASWTISQIDGEVYKLTASKQGFTGDVPTEASAAKNSECVLDSCTLTATLGTNSYSVTEDAPKQTGSHNGVASYFVVSNLGGRSKDEKSVVIEAQSDVKVDPTSKVTTFTVTGVYPVFNNMVSKTASNTVAVDNKMTLTTGNTFEIEFGPETNAFHAFAYPATHSLSSVEIYNTMSKEYEAYSGGSSTEDATYAIQNVDTDYKVWKRAGNAYTETTKFKFTLNKNLNTK